MTSPLSRKTTGSHIYAPLIWCLMSKLATHSHQLCLRSQQLTSYRSLKWQNATDQGFFFGLPTWNDLDFTLSQPSKSSKHKPRVGLVSRVSVSKWSYLSLTAFLPFPPLLQEKKGQLQPLSSKHLLLSCGDEAW